MAQSSSSYHSRADLEKLKRHDLQRLAKKYQLKANGKNSEIIDRILGSCTEPQSMDSAVMPPQPTPTASHEPTTAPSTPDHSIDQATTPSPLPKTMSPVRSVSFSPLTPATVMVSHNTTPITLNHDAPSHTDSPHVQASADVETPAQDPPTAPQPDVLCSNTPVTSMDIDMQESTPSQLNSLCEQVSPTVLADIDMFEPHDPAPSEPDSDCLKTPTNLKDTAARVSRQSTPSLTDSLSVLATPTVSANNDMFAPEHLLSSEHDPHCLKTPTNSMDIAARVHQSTPSQVSSLNVQPTATTSADIDMSAQEHNTPSHSQASAESTLFRVNLLGAQTPTSVFALQHTTPSLPHSSGESAHIEMMAQKSTPSQLGSFSVQATPIVSGDIGMLAQQVTPVQSESLSVQESTGTPLLCLQASADVELTESPSVQASTVSADVEMKAPGHSLLQPESPSVQASIVSAGVDMLGTQASDRSLSQPDSPCLQTTTMSTDIEMLAHTDLSEVYSFGSSLKPLITSNPNNGDLLHGSHGSLQPPLLSPPNSCMTPSCGLYPKIDVSQSMDTNLKFYWHSDSKTVPASVDDASPCAAKQSRISAQKLTPSVSHFVADPMPQQGAGSLDIAQDSASFMRPESAPLNCDNVESMVDSSIDNRASKSVNASPLKSANKRKISQSESSFDAEVNKRLKSLKTGLDSTPLKSSAPLMLGGSVPKSLSLRKTFDLNASLKRKLMYEPKKGPIQPHTPALTSVGAKSGQSLNKTLPTEKK